MSGYAQFHAEERGAGERIVTMTKPFTMTSLAEKMDEVLHGAAAEARVLKG
jgi:hypothetical protein